MHLDPKEITATGSQRPRLRDPRIAAFVILWGALLALAPSHMLRDPGTFWHTVVGEKILSTGRIVDTDPFSFTRQGDEWLAQQWLGECAMALIHRIAGLDGIVLLAATVIAAIFAAVFGRFTRAGIPMAMATFATAVTVGASSYHFIPRPHLATLAGMTLLMLLLLDVEAGRVSPTRLWCLPPLFVVWVNTHGGVLGGLATLVIFALLWLIRPRLLRGRRAETAIADLNSIEPSAADGVPVARPRAPLLGTVVALCTITVLVNPFGPALPRVWLSLMGSSVIPKVIIEHARLAPISPEGGMILLLAAGYFYLLYDVQPRGVRVAWLLPAIWFLLALSRVRHGPIFAILVALAIADMIPHSPACRRWIASMKAFKPLPRRHPGVAPMAVAIAAMFAAALGIQALGWKLPIIGAGRCVATNADWPVDAVALLDKEIADADRPVHVYNDMRFGGYLAYAAPHALSYIDDRCELHHDEGLLRYIELQKHPERLPGEAARYGFDYALIRTGSSVHKYMDRSNDWTLMHTNATATLFKAAPPSSPTVAIAKPQPQR